MSVSVDRKWVEDREMLKCVEWLVTERFPGLNHTVNPEIVDDIFIDLDGVVFDFEGPMTAGGYTADVFKLKPGSYLWLPLVEDAMASILALNFAFPGRVWFLTKPPKHSPYAYVEKALAVQHHFGDEGLHRLIVSQDKSLMGTERSIMIDDRPHKGNLEKFRGKVIHFAGAVNSPDLEDEPTKTVDWNQCLVIISNIIKQKTLKSNE